MSNASNEKPDAGGAHDLQPAPPDFVSPQYTIRAIFTGMILAGLLASCNIYLGLKIGWGFNMAITAALVGYGAWLGLDPLLDLVSFNRLMQKLPRLSRWLGVGRFGMLENNINQTAASAGASVSSAGLVAPIPALAMLTGQTLEWHWMALWVFSVCIVGIAVAIGLRRQMIIQEKLPFAAGIATAETLRELYAKGSEALKRVALLVGAAVVAAPWQWWTSFPIKNFKLPQFVLPVGFTIKGLSAKALTFGLNPTLLMYAVGGLVGIRACISLLLGAILAWGVLAPALIHSGHLRLELSEPLPAVPAGVDLRPDNEGYPKFDVAKNMFAWKGVMTDAQRDRLLSQSEDERYRETVHRAYVRSQLGDGQVVNPAVEYTTTRRVQMSEPLSEYPRKFALPRECSGALNYDKERRALIARESLTAGVVERVTVTANEHAQRNPAQTAACDALIAAVTKLHQRSQQPPLPVDYAVPVALQSRVKYDPATGTLRATGQLAQSDGAELLKALPAANPAYADYSATARALIAGSKLTHAEPDYPTVVKWLLWPGVTLMVIASLVSFGFSWRSIAASFRRKRPGANEAAPPDVGEVPRTAFVGLLLIALVLSVALQVSFFKIVAWAAAVGVLVSFVLALVAARVSGETNITPVGAMGKVTQLLFGVITPGHVEPNLMAANVTGGAASQCAELLHDLKCGYLVGALPRLQVWAQLWGVLAGSLAGAFIYLVLVPHPQEQLMTTEWAAPSVATWKAVAELFQIGLKALPAGTPLAMIIAGVAAIVLTVLEKVVPKKARWFVPSPASLGLAFVIQAYTSTTMFIGALVALLVSRFFKDWSARYLITICAGIIAGESLTGVGSAMWKIATGM